MRPSLRKPALLLLALCLACAVPQLLAKKKEKPAQPGPNEQKRAVHALNRLTFGPRPGDVQQVTAIGVDAWIEQQLHPEKISDAAIEARLAPFRTLRMSSRELTEQFPDSQLIKQVMEGKRSMPSDPARRAVFQVQIARLQDKRERKEEKTEVKKEDKKQRQEDAASPSMPPAADAATTTEPAKTGEELSAANSGDAAATAKTAEELAAAAAADSNSMSAPNAPATSIAPAEESMTTPSKIEAKEIRADDPEARRREARLREDRLYADLKVQSLVDLPPDQRYKKIMGMSADEQLLFANSLRGGKGQEFLEGLDPRQKEVLLAMNNPQAVVSDELIQAKLLRAIYGQRQLEEVMTDFWFNHFNVFVNKGADRVLLTNYEQEVIRPRALGKFEDLLVATAKSPAMLFYLDNWLSVGPNSMQAEGIPARPGPYRRPPRYPGRNPNAHEKRKRTSGLNENYGRELLELHTLSVNGGYSQRDVTEVAKVFTGWTIDKPFEGGGFRFDPRMHEPGPKFVLGHRIKPKGEDEGREVLHRLATSPQTAHFISLKLAQRFVSDDPPPALVDRMAKTFEKKKGDIRQVLSTLFHSPEFWADGTYRAKMKTPLEFVASAVRATGAEVDDAMPLARQIGNMGMPLYGAQPPTGYSMKAETWVSSSALLTRMNFALALTASKLKGVTVDAKQLAGNPPPPDATATLSALETELLAADVSQQTHDSIMTQIETQKKPAKPDPGTMTGLLLGSPEFQKK